MSDIKFECNKEAADANKYYELFKNHVDDFKDGERILFIHIGNFDVLNRFISSNPNCKYVIIDQYLNGNLFEVYWPEIKFLGSKEDESILTALETLTNMKFDKIIMNPPYNNDLHLKIFAKAIEKLKDDESTCVNISPVRWLQDPFHQFKKHTDITKFNDSILKYLDNLEVIEHNYASDCFHIPFFVDLGIYKAKQTTQDNHDYSNFWKNRFSQKELSIFEKITKKHCKPLNELIEKNKRDGIRVLIAYMAGNRGSLPVYKDLAYVINGMKNEKDWTECKSDGGYKKEKGIPIPLSIKFNSEKEAQNFYDSYRTKFAKFISGHYIAHQIIPLYWLPWMGDCINPRTKKKGYESDWTDADFYQYFNITEDEQKLIEKTMEKYK